MTVSQLDRKSTRCRRVLLGLTKTIPVIAATALLAACGSGSPTTAASGSAAASAGASTGTGTTSAGKVSIFVIGGKSDDPFWSSVKRGGEDAAKVVQAAGGTVTFLGPQNYDNLGPDAAKLTQTALSQNPTVVVGPDWVPEAQNAAYKEVSGKNIPLFIYNAGGTEQAKEVGALKYIGSDDYEAGKAGGAAFASAGVKNVLCVNTVPGSTNQENRCKGIKDGATSGGSTSTQLALPSSNFGNPSAVTQAIKAALLKDDTIDGVVTIGTTDADSAANALSQGSLTDKVKLGTFDVSSSQLDRISGGKQLFAIDQQPYLQGYYAVSMAFQYASYGLFPPQNPILTGPLVITKSNVKAAIDGAKTGVR